MDQTLLLIERIGTAFSILHVLLWGVVLPQLMLQRKESQATIAWFFAIVFIPVLGSLVYLAFGKDRLARRVARQRERSRDTRALLPAIISNLDSIDQIGQANVVKLLNEINDYPPVQNNAIDVLTDMHANFMAQLEAIEQATDHVHLEYYIFRPDAIGERFSRAMRAAAKRGVEVRFLFDAVGGMMMTAAFLKELDEGGVQIARHIPMNLFTRRWIFNFRNHRKILVVDGKVAFMGGANIGEEYLGRSEIGSWFDLHLRIEGPAVIHLQRIFADDWGFASAKSIQGVRYFPAPSSLGNTVSQIIPGGPDLDQATLHELFFVAISGATERVRIMTPYFVPTEPLRVALETAGRRGIDVQIVVPAVNTKEFVKLAARSYYEELLEAGVKIYEYQTGFLHAKMMTIDGRFAFVGTPNFDARSLKLNFEVGAAIYDPNITLELDGIFDRTLRQSQSIALETWTERSIPARILQNFARLFSPML